MHFIKLKNFGCSMLCIYFNLECVQAERSANKEIIVTDSGRDYAMPESFRICAAEHLAEAGNITKIKERIGKWAQVSIRDEIQIKWSIKVANRFREFGEQYKKKYYNTYQTG